jgi:hypothetical protein
MPMDDEDEEGFAINGEEHDKKTNNDDEFNDGIWSAGAFLKEIYQSERALQKPSHPVPDISVPDASVPPDVSDNISPVIEVLVWPLANISPNTVTNMESFILHQAINRVTTKPEPNKKQHQT